jgi:hypothetical protein
VKRKSRSIGRQLWVAAIFFISTPTLAWNAAGHRLSAAIAWHQMSDSTRTALGAMLAHHPDHALWLKRSRSEDSAYAAFLEASTWPDDIKRDKRFHDTDEAVTPVLPGFSEMARHRHWHHVDYPLGTHSGKQHGKGVLDRQLVSLLQRIKDPATNSAQRAIDLAWLIHLVGDAHQPLHVVSRYDETGRGDGGGNALWIENPFHPRRSSMTLHAYWDDLPGPPWLRDERLEAAASALMKLGERIQSTGSVALWLTESRSLAKTAAYDGLEGEVPTLSAGYHEQATLTARKQVAIAGRRLGLLLEQLLSR